MSINRIQFQTQQNEDLELLLFSRHSQDVRLYGENEKFLFFETGKWYRVAYRRDIQMNEKHNFRMEPFVFLEHPEKPGIAIGFKTSTFYEQG